jgi:hypothetical protein
MPPEIIGTTASRAQRKIRRAEPDQRTKQVGPCAGSGRRSRSTRSRPWEQDLGTRPGNKTWEQDLGTRPGNKTWEQDLGAGHGPSGQFSGPAPWVMLSARSAIRLAIPSRRWDHPYGMGRPSTRYLDAKRAASLQHAREPAELRRKGSVVDASLPCRHSSAQQLRDLVGSTEKTPTNGRFPASLALASAYYLPWRWACRSH